MMNYLGMPYSPVVERIPSLGQNARTSYLQHSSGEAQLSGGAAMGTAQGR